MAFPLAFAVAAKVLEGWVETGQRKHHQQPQQQQQQCWQLLNRWNGSIPYALVRSGWHQGGA